VSQILIHIMLQVWSYSKKPSALSEVIGNTNVVHALRSYLSANRFPNTIITGDHGTGKRTLAVLTIKEYLGDYAQDGCLVIDGAVNRGKDAINNLPTGNTSKQGLSGGRSVYKFSRDMIKLPPGKVKVVLIFNFDDMTQEAQNALRRIMELCEATTRFMLICNGMDKVIEAIQSRCIPLKTKLLDRVESNVLISSLSSDMLDEIRYLIILMSDGDMKKIINYVQCLNVWPKDKISVELFYNIFNIPPVRYLEQILTDIHQGINVHPRVEDLLRQGYNQQDLLEVIEKILVYRTDLLPNDVRISHLYKVSRFHMNISQQTSPVQIHGLFARLGLP
jgi:DNA polymerase III delta prime subunit